MSTRHLTPEPFSPVTDSRPEDTVWPAMAWPPPPEIRLTGRVVDLEPVVPARDAGPLFDALDHDTVWRHVPGRPRSVAEYADVLQAHVDRGWLPWLVRLRHDSAGLPAKSVVGTSSYLDVSVPDARLEIGSTAYAPAVWGTLVNPEAKLLLLGHAFEVLRAGRVQLKTDVRNARSQRAIARLGARYEGTLRRYQRRADGTVRDTALFSVIAEEWPEVRERLRARLA